MPREDLPILNLSNPLHKRLLIQHVKQMEGICRVEITKVRNQRSLEANAYMWGVVYPCIAKAFAANEGEAEPDIATTHARLKEMFLRRPVVRKDTGEVTGFITPSSADLDVAEFSAYLERCIQFARDELMVHVPPAGDYEQQPERKTA